MPWLALRTRACSALRRPPPTVASSSSLLPVPRRRFGSSIASHAKGTIREVPILPSRDTGVFEQAYKRNLPVRLPRSRTHLPPACSKWFIHDGNPDFDLFGSPSVITDGDVEEGRPGDWINVPRSSELRTSFWSEHESTFVPLEITTRDALSVLPPGSIDAENEGFERITAPLKILIAYLARPPTTNPTNTSQLDRDMSIYLAQCDLSSLPESMQSDVPIPKLLRPPSSSRGTIKGDIYASSLWLGRPPTYTPLHRDPNPNLFIQLAGQKTIRLLPPEIGDALYHEVITKLSPTSTSFSTAIRGEEMMVGPQKAALHDAIWDPSSIYSDLVGVHGIQTTLRLGEALFTPKGWWHSVKGVGDGVTASVNWWFR
ncbi:uncharacterized protein PV07_03727 [Cladophialophora immunda]|uniref:JmjC domain-containing protein n=1 Tax=Cladophialophora immunda TaxID=569365 RepID=A0A0D2CQC8_9EURO|nr:uncharacterized protein PV07_03727 [Cladophialophora immunda]KIW32160.1 hypothetical protein PV07_03727 [Cladophialophora immunda]OQV08248.1 Cupin-like domain-containing protein [Cladophialophora immunda]